MANEQNLIPFGDPRRTESQQREIRKNGGVASGKARRQKKQEQEEWLRLLNISMKGGKAEKIKNLSEAKTANMKADALWKVRIIQEGIKRGDINTYIKVLQLAGLLDPEPPEEVTKEEQQDNAFLKALNDSAKEVWKNEQANEEG